MATIWRIALEAQYGDGTLVVNTLHLKDDPVLGPDARSASQMCDEVDTWLNLKWRNCAFSDVTLTDIKATEEVNPPDVPAQHVKSINLAGTLGTADGKGSRAACVWSKSSTGVPVRGAHGGWHAPPWNHSAAVDSSGLWNTSFGGWAEVGNFNTALLAGHDYGTILGHISYVIASRTRHRRGDPTWYFDVSGMTRARQMHFLRSRLDTP